MNKLLRTNIIVMLLLLFFSNNSMAQTNPAPQQIPFLEDFGINFFTAASIPQGFSIWTSTAAPQSSPTAAAASTANGDQTSFDSATVIKSTGRTYGYSAVYSGTSINNGKIYLQTSSSSTDQLVLAINTTGFSAIKISYNVEMLNPQPRRIGITLQYRIGTTGAFNTLDSSYWYSSANRSQNTFDYITNLSLPPATDNQPVVQIRWATSRSSTPSSGSSGVGIDDIVVTGTRSPDPLFFRSVASGNWNSPSTWESSIDNITWTPATSIPSAGDNQITIESPHVIKTTGTTNLIIDEVIVKSGATLWNASGTRLGISDGPGVVDLDVNGTFIDSSNYSVVWPLNTTWRLGANGTFIKNSNTNSTTWQLQYYNNIINIPATSNWICRKPAGALVEPSISTTNGGPPNSQVYYGNLYIENNSASWNSSNLCKFSGSANFPIIKGNLFIGGNGSGNVNFYNSNSNMMPIKVIGDINIASGSVYTATGTGTEVQGNINCNGTYTNLSSTSKLLFSGNKQQSINGNGSISTYNLEINKIGGNVTLNNNLKVSGNLNLISGIAFTNSSAKISIEDNGTTTNASDISYVDGPVQKKGDDAFTFPVGKAGNYQPVSLNAGVNNTTSDAFTAEYFNVNPQTIYGNNLAAGLDSISQCEYWTLSMDMGSSQKNVTLTWDGNSCAITNLSALRVARFNSTTWEDQGTLFTTGSNSAGTVCSNPATGFGPFTIAYINVTNTLPITLLSFSAIYNGKEVKLSWVTSSEINNDFFTIERSRDGKSFDPILTQPGSGTSNRLQYYGAEDMNPLTNISYYRLKQTNYDGTHTYSDIIPIRIKLDEARIVSIQPSRPNSLISFDVNFPESTEGIIKIIDMNGKLGYGSKFTSGAQQKHFTIDSSQMPSGVYFLQVIFGDNMVEKKFVY